MPVCVESMVTEATAVSFATAIPTFRVSKRIYVVSVGEHRPLLSPPCVVCRVGNTIGREGALFDQGSEHLQEGLGMSEGRETRE